MTAKLGIVIIVASALWACGPTVSQPAGDAGPGQCITGETRCQGNAYQSCTDDTWTTDITCTDPTPYCSAENQGCSTCPASQNYCDGTTVRACDASGNPGGVVEECTNGDVCSGGACRSPCADAESANSYIGCEYYAVPTANGGIDTAFDNNFGIVVSNANGVTATVTVSGGGLASPIVQEIPANSVHEFKLAMDTGLQGDGITFSSQQVPNAAYHVVSSLPVTVYQFSPLDYTIGTGFSYSNDASLLLPVHVLSNNYITMSRQTFGVENCSIFGCVGTYTFLPGFITIVGTEAGTQVTVTSSANTQGGSVAALTPGGSATYTIGAGEAIQILSQVPGACSGGTTTTNDCGQPGTGAMCQYCDMGSNYDLTGTVVSSTAPVAVLGGHNCSFVPYSTWACDHLEETMLPLETWGKEFVVGRTKPQNDPTFTTDPEPNVIRVMSGADGNNITFNPPQSLGASVTLQKGEWREFLATGDFEVIGSDAISVAQHVVGQNYYTDNLEYHGDPAYAMMVPSEQFRNEYTFLAPSTMTYNFVNVTKRVGPDSETVFLDDVPIPEADFGPAIGNSGYGTASVAISGTAHSIRSSDPFGIVVYGFATYTSYMYPGGLDLEFINPID